MSLSALSKAQLIFDPANPTEGDNIGSFTRAGTDGTLISTTNVSGKDGLDVNLINTSVAVTGTFWQAVQPVSGTVAVTQSTSPWVVSATSFDIRPLIYSTDNVAIKGATGNQLVVNADGSLNVNADISVTNGSDKLEDAASANGDTGTYVLSVRQDVLATSTSADGDFQSFKTDSLGRLWTTANVDSSVADDAVDSGNPIKVGTRALGTLTALSASGDRADMIADLYRRLYVNTGANVGMAFFATAVANTAGGTQLSATPIASRREIMIQNLDNKAIYVGPTGLTAATGIKVPAGASMQLEVGPNLDLYALATSATADVRIMELG